MLDMLVIAPHPDDAELGMGATICKCLAEGMQVGILDMTDGEPTPHGSVQTRRRETEAATAALGVPWRENLGLPNRRLEPTLQARARLAGMIRQTRPRWLMAPYWEDAHPDHVAATELIEAARFWAKLTKSDLPGEPFYPERIFYYYCIHLRMVPQPSFIVDVSDYLEKKLEAVACYRSQFIDGREHLRPNLIDRLRDQASTWGWLIGAAYGEPFSSREAVGLNTLAGLR